MPRQLRLEYADAIYHVMNREDRGEVIVAKSGRTSAMRPQNRTSGESMPRLFLRLPEE